MKLSLVLLLLCSTIHAAPERRASSTAYVSGWTVGAALSYPVTQRKYDFEGQRTSTGQRIKATFEFESQPGIDLFVKWTRENNFGFSAGYEMIPASKMTGGSLTIGNTSYDPVTYTFLDKFAINIVHIGTEYRKSALYFPFEIALYMPPKITAHPNHLGLCQGGGMSYRGGVGYYFHRHLFGEISYRDHLLGYCENLSSTNDSKDEYNTGHSKEITLVVGGVL